MPFCPNCGKKISEDTKFCPECRQRLVAEIGLESIETGTEGLGTTNWTTNTEEIMEALGIPKEKQGDSEELKDIPDSILLEHITSQLNPRYCEKCGCQLKARWLQKEGFDKNTGYPKYDVIIACPHATIYETSILSKPLVTYKGPFNRHTVNRVSMTSNRGGDLAENIHNNTLGIWSLRLGIIRCHVSKYLIAGIILGIIGVVLFIVLELGPESSASKGSAYVEDIMRGIR